MSGWVVMTFCFYVVTYFIIYDQVTANYISISLSCALCLVLNISMLTHCKMVNMVNILGQLPKLIFANSYTVYNFECWTCNVFGELFIVWYC